MKRRNLIKIHVFGTIIGFLTLLSFLILAAASVIKYDFTFIKNVKKFILLFVPLIAVSLLATGLSGKNLVRGSYSPIYSKKMMRLKIIAMNSSLLLLVAFYLYIKSSKNQFSIFFWTAQIAGFFIGCINIILYISNILLGFVLKGRCRIRITRNKPNINLKHTKNENII